MKIKLKNGKIIAIAFQQYAVGLYVCLYDETGYMIDQFGLDTTRDQFIEAVKNGKVFEGVLI